MKKHILSLVVLTLALAACSPPATPAPQVTEAPAPTLAPPTQADPLTTEPTQPAAVEPTATTAPAASSPAVYKIVPGESQLKYEVGEVFLNQDNAFKVAVGISPTVNGEITIDPTAVQNSQIGAISADISQFTSDSSRRDGAIRTRFLESQRYPTVTFFPTQIEGLPDSYQEGQEISLKISGDLTIREVTKPAQFDAVVKLEGDTLTGAATTTILMSDYGFGPISIAGVLNTEDEVKITLTLVARP